MPLEDGISLGSFQVQSNSGIDYDNRCSFRVQPGALSLTITRAVRRRQGFYYAPDPSSQIACSIGGNVAENAGGVHRSHMV